MKKVQIFIDSGNFYHLVLKKLGLKELILILTILQIFLPIKEKLQRRAKDFIPEPSEKSRMATKIKKRWKIKQNYSVI